MNPLIKKIRDAGLFDLYGIKLIKGSGVYMRTSKGLKKIMIPDISEVFDFPITYQSPVAESLNYKVVTHQNTFNVDDIYTEAA